MAKIRKLNVSEIVGINPPSNGDAVMPAGTIVVYEFNNNGVIDYVLRVHDGVTDGGVPFANAPSIEHNNDINITVNSGDSSSYTWNFSQTGVLTAPGTAIFNGTAGIVVDNLNAGIAGLFNDGDVYITGGNSVRFTGLDTIDGISESVLRFWNAEGRHSSGNDPTELVTLDVGNDATNGDPTEGFFKIVTEKEIGGEKEWKFDANGVLTLPVGGDIVDSTGASVLGSGVSIDRNIWIQTFATDSDTDKAALASSVEYDSAGNVYALFLHQQYNDLENPSSVTGSYFSVAKFASTGEKLWSVRSSSANVFTDGWGLAVDNANSAFYVAGKTDVAESYSRSFLVKFNSDDGSQVWASTLDFNSQSDSPVVDIASDGNPVVVGYLSIEEETGFSDGVTVTKISRTDGSILWSQLLDGQGDDEAYGMAVGPNGEIVAVGYTSQIGIIDAADNLYADLAGRPNWTIGGSIDLDGVTADFTFTDGFPTFTNIVDTVGGRTIDAILGTVLGSAIGGVDGVDDMVVKVETVAANDEDDRMLVVKYDSDGVIVWQKAIQFDAGYDCYGADADIDADGNVYINGNYRYESGQAPFATSAMSIVKFDSNGAAQWSRRVVGDCDDFTTSIVVGPENTLYLTGVTTRPDDDNKYIWVVAKYTTSGSVIWQRLIENNSQWSFSGGFFGSSGGGSSLAVKEGYVALSGAFGVPFDGASTATVVQLDFDGTVFTVGDWEVKVASFSGTLSSDASDITVINADKTDSSLTGTITIDDSVFAFDDSNFLVPTLYRSTAGGAGDITFEGVNIIGRAASERYGLINLVPALTADDGFNNINFLDSGQYVSIYPTMAFDAPHIHIAAGIGLEGEGDLFLGDDNKYVSVNSGGNIRIQSFNSETNIGHQWNFGTDGILTLPGNIATLEIDEANPDGGLVVSVDAGIPESEYKSLYKFGRGGQFTSRAISVTDANGVRVGGLTGDGFGPILNAPADKEVWISTDGQHLWRFTADRDFVLPYGGGNIRSEGNINIDINLSDSTMRRWQFGEDGDLTFPDATVQTTAFNPGSFSFPVVTTSDLSDDTNAINTTGKLQGKPVWASDDYLIYVASGSSASSVWRGSDGTTIQTPVTPPPSGGGDITGTITIGEWPITNYGYSIDNAAGSVTSDPANILRGLGSNENGVFPTFAGGTYSGPNGSIVIAGSPTFGTTINGSSSVSITVDGVTATATYDGMSWSGFGAGNSLGFQNKVGQTLNFSITIL